MLRSHAEAGLADAYDNAVELAIAETGLARGAFPAQCPYTVEHLLAADVAQEENA